MFFQIVSVNKATIILVMLHLKMEQAEEVVLETLISQIIFLIFLKIFLVILVVEAEEEEAENQISEDQILGMTYQSH